MRFIANVKWVELSGYIASLLRFLWRFTIRHGSAMSLNECSTRWRRD